jgi:hypothetical protein
MPSLSRGTASSTALLLAGLMAFRARWRGESCVGDTKPLF